MQITLDVTPPEVVYDDPGRVSMSDFRARVPYLIDADGTIATATIDADPADILADALVSADAYPSPALLDVQAVAVDDVGNQAQRDATLWLGPVQLIGTIARRVVSLFTATGSVTALVAVSSGASALTANVSGEQATAELTSTAETRDG